MCVSLIPSRSFGEGSQVRLRLLRDGVDVLFDCDDAECSQLVEGGGKEWSCVLNW